LAEPAVTRRGGSEDFFGRDAASQRLTERYEAAQQAIPGRPGRRGRPGSAPAGDQSVGLSGEPSHASLHLTWMNSTINF
ncbi:MAG: hypothetical protein R3349_10890, partial [Geminicoccaceae bacterium]|nr:hypothetical protein [Geminicoccaceae bacterium]